MIDGVVARATALGWLALAWCSSCSSHVDVGFASDGGVQMSPDAGDTGDSARSLADTGSDSGPTCIVVTACAKGRMVSAIEPNTESCRDACKQSSPDCDVGGVDLSQDPKNCGSCEHECAPFETCVKSECTR